MSTPPSPQSGGGGGGSHGRWTPYDADHAAEARARLAVWPLDEYNASLLDEVHPRRYNAVPATAVAATSSAATVIPHVR